MNSTLPSCVVFYSELKWNMGFTTNGDQKLNIFLNHCFFYIGCVEYHEILAAECKQQTDQTKSIYLWK